VRDVALGCGKEVGIEMEGKETELDKTIIEAIKDPLTHLVSLCCRQHKPTYVAQGFMWRSPREARQNSLFDLGERHITFGGRWTGGLKDQGSGKPYSVFAEAWQACHKRKKSGK
jgi:two-component system chemotaxis sensor kinase CheA